GAVRGKREHEWRGPHEARRREGQGEAVGLNSALDPGPRRPPGEERLGVHGRGGPGLTSRTTVRRPRAEAVREIRIRGEHAAAPEAVEGVKFSSILPDRAALFGNKGPAGPALPSRAHQGLRPPTPSTAAS